MKNNNFHESGITQRLKEFIKHLGLSHNEFGRQTGFASGALSKIVTHSRSFGVNKLHMISKAYPQLNLNWLVTGEGPMLLEGDFYQLPERLSAKEGEIGTLQVKLEAYQEVVASFAQGPSAEE